MRIRLGPMVAASVLALSLAAPVSAQTSEEWFKLTSAGSTMVNSVYVGPYTAMELGTGALPAQSGPLTDIYCVDYFGHASIGEPFHAWVTPLSSSAADLDASTNGGSSKLQQYMMAAWLTEQFQTVQPLGMDPLNYWDIHATIWNLLDAAAPDPSSNYWYNLAAANYTTIDPHAFSVVHSFDPRSYQEFMIATPVPEPVSSTLLLGGLLGVGAGWLRRRRGQPEA